MFGTLADLRFLDFSLGCATGIISSGSIGAGADGAGGGVGLGAVVREVGVGTGAVI